MFCVAAPSQVAGEPSTVSTICGETDDRELSTIPRASRYMGGGGCSGWLIHDANHCFLTAGHCGNPAGGGTMQFQVRRPHCGEHTGGTAWRTQGQTWVIRCDKGRPAGRQTDCKRRCTPR